MTEELEELKYYGPRAQLVKTIASKGISDPRVLEAIGKVPRHLFVEPALRPYAYEDRPLPIGEGQTISQPFTVAYMTQLLNVKPGMKVLEIGTGSGYQTAVLLEMGARVYTVERIGELYKETKERLESLGYRPDFMAHADGYEGLPQFAPYDRIIVTAAAPHIPTALLKQLKPGGIMVIPVGIESQDMIRIVKDEQGKIRKEYYDKFTFVPLLRDKE